MRSTLKAIQIALFVAIVLLIIVKCFPDKVDLFFNYLNNPNNE